MTAPALLVAPLLKLDELRLSIPAIIEPLTTTGISAQEHFRRFRDAAQGEHSRLDRFRATWQSGPIAEALEYTLLSGRQGQNRSNGIRLPKYGWSTDGEPVSRGTGKQGEANHEPNGTVGSQTEDMESVVKAFQQKHPECHIDSNLSEQNIQISVPAPLGPISFTIKKGQKPQNEGPRWDVECLGSMKLYPAITRCLASRPKGNDLEYTLVHILHLGSIDVANSIGNDCGLQGRSPSSLYGMWEDGRQDRADRPSTAEQDCQD
ncbi:MAG: hypothetical protein Q9165_002933 [Trypethelium subeluteriae]